MRNSIAPNKFGVFSLAAGAALLSIAVFVKHASAAEASDKPLTILITASRTAETVDETLSPVTVITRDEINESQANSVEEVLRTVLGVHLSSNGGAGQRTSLFLRGTEPNHTLVLIDGVKIGSATTGLAQIEHLPLAQIEKIEVVRGPRSSLYGSEAVGGVIQIFTRRGGDGDEPTPRFAVSGGSHNAAAVELGISDRGAAGWFGVNVAASHTAGFNACAGSASPFAGCFVPENALETDADGHQNNSISARFGVNFTDSFSLEGGLLNSASETEFDGVHQNMVETDVRQTNLKFIWQSSGEWESLLLFSEAEDKSQNYVDCDVQANPTPNSFSRDFDPPCVTNVVAVDDFDRIRGTRKRGRFNTERNQIQWQGTVYLNPDSHFTVGAERLNDRVRSTTEYTVERRETEGVFGLYRNQLGAHDIEFALREEDNEQFGAHTTGSLGWGRKLNGGNRLTASYGTAFAAPSLNELYFPPNGNRPTSNPNLQPETSKSLDVGVAHTADNFDASLHFYRTEIDNLIALDNMFVPQNIAEATIGGAELSIAARGAGVAWSANFSYVRAKQATGANKGNDLTLRPATKFDVDVSDRVGRFSWGANLYAQDASFDDSANTRELNGFATLDLRGALQFNKNWSFGLKLNNVLDKEYETAAYFPQDGRNWTATLRYTPQ